MKYILSLILVLTLVVPVFSQEEGLEASDGMMKRIEGDENTDYVTFSWKIAVNSDRDRGTCFFKMSLRDGEEMELKKVMEIVNIKEGHNLFTGTGVVKSSLWFQMKSSPMGFSCPNK